MSESGRLLRRSGGSICQLHSVTCLLLLALSSCVGIATEKPLLMRCGVDGAASAGEQLPILQSEVPGLAIDSSSWVTHSYTFDMGAATDIVLSTTLRTTAAVALDSVALVYTFRHPRSGDTTRVVNVAFWPPSNTPISEFLSVVDSRTHLRLPADTSIGVAFSHEVQSGSRAPGKLTAVCPISVQAVRRRDLVRHLWPRLLDRDNLQRLIAEQRATDDSGPVLFVLDTLIPLRMPFWLVAGIVVNTADTASGPITAGLVIDTTVGYVAGRTIPPSWSNADTLEYPIGPLAPNAVVPFSGGQVMGDRVLQRRAYPTPQRDSVR